MRRAAGLVEEDDALGLGRKVERIDRACDGTPRQSRISSEFSATSPRPAAPRPRNVRRLISS